MTVGDLIKELNKYEKNQLIVIDVDSNWARGYVEFSTDKIRVYKCNEPRGYSHSIVCISSTHELED